MLPGGESRCEVDVQFKHHATVKEVAFKCFFLLQRDLFAVCHADDLVSTRAVVDQKALDRFNPLLGELLVELGIAASI